VFRRGSGRKEASSADLKLDNPAVSVLTVDDQLVFRDLARLVLQTTPGFRSVGEAASGEQALEMVDELKPQLVLVDVRMPGIGGIETARRICAAHPEAVVVLISIEDPVDLPSAAEASGAVALVRKQDFGATLLRDLWAAHGAK
jgi:two-component system, NarL family, invasion response regulator UvrY